ncbi:hypothetical protein HZA57_01840 [Candidatus Poribacteria bacterium]|nr:hypothetical protein [Candidatus Poribacteria bacterium]
MSPALSRGPARWTRWIRPAVPVVILLVYAAYKLLGWEPKPRAPRDAEPYASLSGVAAEVKKVPLDEQTKQLLAKLEGLYTRENWTQIRAVAASAPQDVRRHPAVRAFDAIARVHTGETSAEVMTEIRDLESYFASDPKQRAMLESLQLVHAEILFRVSTSPDAMMRNTDRFRQLAGNAESLTPQLLAFRVKLAERFEEMGNQEAAGAGRFMKDRVQLTTARSLYQQGLRWVTTREGWLARQPLSSGKASAIVDRLVLHIREMNKEINGLAMPWGGGDRETWTGKAGDPIHDYPGGTW